MKRFLCIVLIISLSLCLAGCKLKDEVIIDAVTKGTLAGYGDKKLEQAIGDFFDEHDIGLGEISVSPSEQKNTYEVRIPAEISYQYPLVFTTNDGVEVEILSLAFVVYYDSKTENIVDVDIIGMIAANAAGIMGSVLDGRSDSKRDFTLLGIGESAKILDVVYNK